MSLKEYTVVPQEMLGERLEVIKELQTEETQAYVIQKDQVTGEHYLHYAYIHLNIGGGEQESYNYLMPIDHDEVLTILFDNEPYEYPEHWHKAFLRNGPLGQYVWFDPSDMVQEEEYEETGKKLLDAMKQFKQKGNFDEKAVREFLDQIDRTK